MELATSRVWAGQQWIDGSWEEPTGRVFENMNPARWSEVLGVYPHGSTDDVARAVGAARRAFPGWRATSRIRRGECFLRLAELIRRDTDALAHVIARESGKIVDEARAEVVEGLHMVEYVAGLARQPIGQVLASEIPTKDVAVTRRPRGVVGVITPWNFPFAVPLWMLGPSLLEGNTCVFKPSEETPETGERLARLLVEAGIPGGAFNLVHGLGEDTGAALAAHDDVDVVCFTGSYEVGARIRRLAAEAEHKTCACEMGSKSAVIVCEDADLELAANAALLSAFKTTGQRCVSAGRVLVHERVWDDFVGRFLAGARRVRFGDPFDPHSFAGPLINRAAVDKVRSYNELAREEGATVLLAGDQLGDEAHAEGCYLAPFVYRQDYRPGLRTIREEVFGPHVALIPFADDAEAIRIYNDTPYGLSLGVITEDYRRARRYREECDFGLGYVNLPCIGAEVHLPFGGLKRSGNGQPSAAGLVSAVTHPVAFTVNHEEVIRMAQGMSAKVDG